MTRVKQQLGEFELIARYFAPLAGENTFGLQDDAAFLNIPAGKQLVITQDALAEDVHFFKSDPAKEIAQKALRTNLSDLIAKGAKPFAYSLALGLPEHFDEPLIEGLAEGLFEDQKRYGLYLSGGDTFKSNGGLTLSITALGLVDEGAYVSRLGANEGDVICVSGTIGDGALGLQIRLQNLKIQNAEDEAFLKQRYLLPEPRIELLEVIKSFATASMDISDGFLGDLVKLLKASKKTARIDVHKIPLSKAAQNLPSEQNLPIEIERCLTGGDDYEVLFTLKPQNVKKMQQMAERFGVKVTRVGEVKSAKSIDEDKRLDIVDETGKSFPLTKTSYRHF